MNTGMIEEVTATGEEIHAIVAGMGPFLITIPRGHAVIACLSIAITAMNPNITADELQAGVKGCSEWISLYVTGIGDKIEANKVN